MKRRYFRFVGEESELPYLEGQILRLDERDFNLFASIPNHADIYMSRMHNIVIGVRKRGKDIVIGSETSCGRLANALKGKKYQEYFPIGELLEAKLGVAA